ncbi:MAG: thioredoxin family protein [Halanaerobiales bacterium]
MKKIEIFGTGCPNCQKTEKNVKNVIGDMNLDAEVTKVDDMDEITERGVMLTPAVAVDGNIKITGEVPSEKDIKGWFE